MHWRKVNLSVNPQALQRGKWILTRLLGETIADCTTAIRIKPDHALAYLCRSLAYHYRGNDLKAEADRAKYKELVDKP
jgi:hypothetical protein